MQELPKNSNTVKPATIYFPGLPKALVPANDIKGAVACLSLQECSLRHHSLQIIAAYKRSVTYHDLEAYSHITNAECLSVPNFGSQSRFCFSLLQPSTLNQECTLVLVLLKQSYTTVKRPQKYL